jgi:hypothetical protein
MREDDALDLEVRYVTEGGVTEDAVCGDIIGAVWPTTTSSTMLSPPHIMSGLSSFHTERVDIAAGKQSRLIMYLLVLLCYSYPV